MTLVRVTTAASRGFLWWAPIVRLAAPGGGGAPAVTILPHDLTVPVVAGAAEATVDPTGQGWVWCVLEAFAGLPARRRYFTVPNLVSVDYGDLVEVSPSLLAPDPVAKPDWLAPFEALSAATITPDPAHPGFYLIGA